jgi:hypothetical protein
MAKPLLRRGDRSADRDGGMRVVQRLRQRPVLALGTADDKYFEFRDRRPAGQLREQISLIVRFEKILISHFHPTLSPKRIVRAPIDPPRL